MKSINIPQSGTESEIVIEVEKNLIIVGANGSGKTRFGSRIEQKNNPSKRISAQRYLQLNEVVPRLDFETAENQLRDGYKNQLPITPQNDIQQVLVSLFAEEARRDSQYVIDSKASSGKVVVPQSVKEKMVDVWNFIFPYRILKLERDRVRAASGANDFPATELSDGEKVGLYLICQILLADKDCILIIDEPELHLHKSLMVRLWNKLEELRSDCVFIYITHDLDFAVSKPAGKILWIQKFNENKWEWKELDSNGVIPENLFLEVIGSRKNILFVEGDKGSLDIHIYQAYYENFTVIPRGSCEKVIESVKGLKDNSELHDKKVYGLIDKDFRLGKQLDSLKGNGIFSIPLNKIENLFLVPEIIDIVCTHLGKMEKKEDVVSEIREIYESDKDQINFIAAKYRIQRILNEDFGTLKNQEEYEGLKNSIFTKLDGQFVTLSLPVKESELIKILEVYPHKGLVRRVQTKLELTKDGYKNLVLNLLSSEKRQQILDTLKVYLPKIE